MVNALDLTGRAAEWSRIGEQYVDSFPETVVVGLKCLILQLAGFVSQGSL